MIKIKEHLIKSIKAKRANEEKEKAIEKKKTAVEAYGSGTTGYRIKNGPNKGPSGIMSLDSAGDKDGPVGGYSGADVSAAETGKAVKGMDTKDLAGFRAGAAGQARVQWAAADAGAHAGVDKAEAGERLLLD